MGTEKRILSKKKKNYGEGKTKMDNKVSPEIFFGLPCSSDSKESVCNAEDPDLIPGSGRPSEKGNGNPL